ncbi:unnamed protein product [Triticum turgidum subsp. durum]|uniref:FBD domain-containing protein n=1 Tax=Triticum turgidum subsp. durum TaxID=4567 RepID=A0A9R1A8L3_TRITD|nr:unnamed protein product [Triticum turgidum subsp. durum]
MAPLVERRASQPRGPRPTPRPRRPHPHLLRLPRCRLRGNLQASWPRPPILLPRPLPRRPPRPGGELVPLPSPRQASGASALRSAPTLLAAKISSCVLPREMVPSMGFDLLQRLSLISVYISADVFRGLLPACHALESLHMSNVLGTRCLHVRSPTLRSICFRDTSGKVELVIEDAPRLVRLLMPFGSRDDCGTIRVISAPKLEILGPLLPVVSKLLVSQGISSAGSGNSMYTVKILALRCSGYELDGVLNILRRFPCLEKLYVIFHKHKEMDKKIEPQYDRLHPIECLQTHLKTVVFEVFMSHDKQLEFAKFFVLNAEVLKKIEFDGIYGAYNSISLAYQHRLLRVENRASRDAQFEFMSRHRNTAIHLHRHVHDLSVADPFEQP